MIRRPALPAPLLAFAVLGASAAGAEDAQPRAVPGDVVTDYHGVRIADPYRALEDVDAPATRAWAESETAYTRAQLDRLPGLPALRRRVAVLDADRAAQIRDVQVSDTGAWFWLERAPGAGDFRLVTRDRADAPTRVLLDPAAWRRRTGRAHAIDNFTVSPDGRHVAAVVSQADAELGELRVFDAAGGADELPPVPGVWGELPATWTPDSSAFFFSQSASARAAAARAAAPASTAGDAAPAPVEAFGHMQVFLRRLSGGPDVPVAGAGREFGPPVGDRDWVAVDTGDARHVVVSTVEGVSNDYRAWVADAAALAKDPAHAAWTPVFGLDAQVRGYAAAGHWLHVLSRRDAPRLRVLRYDLDRPSAPPVQLVAQQRGVIEDMRASSDGLYYTVRTGATAELFHLAPGAKTAERTALPFHGAVALRQGSPHVAGAVVQLEGWTREPQLLAARAGRGISLDLVPPRDSDVGADWVSEELTCRSHDGVEVPMSLIYKRGLKKDGSHPVLLDGYGGYGEAVTARFEPRLGALLERGGIFAEVDPRGGGAHGFEWYQAGVGAKKANTWKDMIACAQALVDRGYTTPAKLAIQGTSMGGVAVGRAVTERPDLFGAAIVRVGITDAIRFIEATPNGPNHEAEMGSLSTEAGVRQLLAMSTYHQVRDGEKYPAMLFTAGLNDNRVAPWITFKTFSRFQAASASRRPVLLRVEAAGGHGVTQDAAQRNAELADRIAFLLWQAGDPAFQPVVAK